MSNRSNFARLSRWIAGMLAIALLAALSPAGRCLFSPDVSGASKAWLAVHRARLSDPDLLRYYIFQEPMDCRRSENLAGWTSPLLLPKASKTSPILVPGPEPGSSALSLDSVPLETPVFGVNRTLSIECWIRHYGRGLTIGGNSAGSGTIVAMGDGVWSGFCLSLHFPGNVLAFQLGRPKPLPAVGVTAMQRIPPRTWTHVVATWDGAEIELFVNGLSSGRVAYSGPFFAPKRTSRLRVGYVGNGYGSIQFDLSELAIYRRCLSQTEIFSRIDPDFRSGDSAVTRLTQASRLLSAGRNQESESLLRELLSAAIPTALDQRARLLLGQCCRERGAVAEAMPLFEELKEHSQLTQIQRQASLEFLALKNDYLQPASIDQRRDLSFTTVNLRDATVENPGWLKAVQQFTMTVTEEESSTWKQAFSSQILPVLQKSCVPCHTADSEVSSLDLTQFRTGEDAAEASSSFWQSLGERVVRGEMPPPGNTASLPDAAKSALLRWINSVPVQGLCEELSADDDQPRFLEEVRWFNGAGVGRRLTRLELKNSLHLLLGETLTDAELPPPEPAGGEGFDTAAGTVTTSSSLIEFLVDSLGNLVDRTAARERAASFAGLRRVLPDNLAALQTQEETSQKTAASDHLAKFAAHAWRRPWSQLERERLLRLYTLVRADGEAFDVAIAESLKAILLSPNFLFVAEAEPAQRGSYRITSRELATRMSLFLWSSIPDLELLQAADAGQLDTPADLRKQIRRMLADERANALGESFGLQWLGLQRLEYLKKDTQLHPGFTPGLLADFREEASRFVAAIFRESRPLLELLNADYVIVNKSLAQHYGLSFPEGAAWQRLAVDRQNRGGILTLGGTLAATSFPGRTSPVLRGKWILEEILGQEILPPPPGTPALIPVAADGRPRSMREQLQVHRSQPGCQTCHETMDQLGFSLENFDTLGQWRQADRGIPVDASAKMPDGAEFQGVEGLRKVVLRRQEEFARNLCRRLAGFAFCRSLDRFDDCIIDRCVQKLKASEWRSTVVLEEIILSFPFRHRFSPGHEVAVHAEPADQK
ncbi:MAG: DUF1592 domain-containing protein [Planctomycetia bacterium]